MAILHCSRREASIISSRIDMRGHAIELRIYAEDPKTFTLHPVSLHNCHGAEVEGVRIDAGYSEGLQVTPFMIHASQMYNICC